MNIEKEDRGRMLFDYGAVTKHLTTGVLKTIDGKNVSVTRGHVVSLFLEHGRSVQDLVQSLHLQFDVHSL